MRIIGVNVGFILNPRMKQVHLKLLLCLLLATTATGQYSTGQYGQNYGAQQQPLALGQSSMSAWGGLSGMGAFGQQTAGSPYGAGLSGMGGFGQQTAASPFGAGLSGMGGFGQQPGITSPYGAGLSGMGGFGQQAAASPFGGGLSGMGAFGQQAAASPFGGGLSGMGGFGQQPGITSPFGAGLSGMGGFGQQPGITSPFGGGFPGVSGFGQQQGVASQVPQQTAPPAASSYGGGYDGGSGGGYGQTTAPDQSRVVGADLTSGTTQQYGSSVAVPAVSDSRSISTSVCFNIIDSAFPSFADVCSVLPQTTFSLPNFFGHQSKQEIDGLLAAFIPALSSRCFKQIRMFTCPLFFPPCDGAPILPCARFCRDVQSRCGGFDLSSINCDRLPETSEFCPIITTVSPSFSAPVIDIRTAPSGGYGPQTSYGNDYASSSVLTRSSSSYGGSNNDFGQTRITGGGYGGGDYGSVSDNSAFVATRLFQAPKPVSILNGPPQSSSINTFNQGFTVGDISGISANGGFPRSAPTLIKSGNDGYGTDGGGYGAPASRMIVKTVESTSYGNVDDGTRTLALGNNIKSFGPTSYGESGGYGGGAAFGSTLRSGGPTSYGNVDEGARTLTFVNNVKSVGPTSYGNVDEGARTLTFVNNVKSVGPTTPFGDGGSYGGGVAFGSALRSGGPTSYGNVDEGARTLTLVNNVKSVGPTSFGDSGSYGGGASFGTALRSGGPTSYGNVDEGARTLAFVNNMKTVGPVAYGNGGESAGTLSFGNNFKSFGSPYGNNNNYGSAVTSVRSQFNGIGSGYGEPYGIQSLGTPFDTRSSGQFNTIFRDEVDLSKCGTTSVAQNPCTGFGQQFFPLPGVPQCYIQCVFDSYVIKPCPSALVWNPRINVCDWPTTPEIVGSDVTFGSSSYGGVNKNFGPTSYGTSTNYGSSVALPVRTIPDSGSSYSYGRKKRATTERKKRYSKGYDNGYDKGYSKGYGKGYGKGSTIVSEVPLAPPVPGLVPLPGFFGPIGFPGPLFPPFIPPIFPPIPPLPPPIFPPPFLPPPILPPIVPFPPPILPPPILPPPIIPPPGIVPPFLPPLIPPLPLPLGGPLLPPLPMSLPATFIPGPPPIFSAPFGGPFGPLGGGFGGPFGPPGGGFGGPFGPLGGGFGGPFGPPGGGFGGPFGPPGGGFGGPFGPLGGGFGGPFGPPGGGFGGPFGPFGGGFGGPFGPPGGGFGGPFGPLGGGFGGPDPFYNDGFYNDPFYGDYGFGGSPIFGDAFYGGPPGPFFEPFPFPASYDDSRSYDGKGSSDDSSYYNDDYYGNYRKKRQYGLNVDQDTSSFSTINQQRALPKEFQLAFKPVQSSSYESDNEQPLRPLPTGPFQTQSQVPVPSFTEPSPCVGKASKSNIPHPTDPRKYISCLNDEKYDIMDCPTGLIYNAAVDQCEKVKNTESICEREKPCLNDGQCYQTSPTTYKCTCRGAWTGEHCETPLSSCASNPCGEDSECHTLVASDYKQDYVCVCDGRQSYGLTCGRNTVPNPCMAASTDREQYYPFAFSAHAYVQCNGDILYVRPCASGLYWNQELKICDREVTSPARPAEDQSQSYQIKQETPLFPRPTVSLTDQNIDKQQGYRYRNYNPHVGSNDQNVIFNQKDSRHEKPIVNSFGTKPFLFKHNTHFNDQQQFQPVQTQQLKKPAFQGTPQRLLFRTFPSPSRTVNTLKTESTSSGYRR